MSTSTQIQETQDTTAKQLHTDIVLEAFGHVAMMFSAALPELLQECRRRGLTDEQTKAALIELENDFPDDRALSAHRNEAGVVFIASECFGVTTYVASVNEAFAALSQNS